MIKEQNNITKKIFYLFLIVLVVVIGFLTIAYLIKDPSSSGEYELKIYGNSNGYICLEGETLCNNVVFTIPTDTNDAKLLTVSEYQSFLLFKDNTLKVYNLDTKEVTELKLENKYDEYELVTNTKDTLLVGVIYKKGNTTGYYNIQKDKKLYENKNFDEIYPINEKVIGAVKNDEEKNYLLSTETDKIINTADGECIKYSTEDDFILQKEGCMGEPTVEIYSSNANIIASNLYSKDYSITNGELNIIEDNQMVTYTKEGSVKEESKQYNKLLQIVGNYMIAVDTTNELIVTDGKDLRIVVTPWNENYYYNWGLTEYKDNYIIIVVEDLHDDESMDASGMRYRVDLKTKDVGSSKVESLYQN